MSKLEVDAIEPQSGTTITIGSSGDTVNLIGTLNSNGSPLPGDISEVVAGTGLSGGGTTGAVTINIDSAQPTITSLGTITGFTSTGIDDNATSTAITINSSEQVSIGTSAAEGMLRITNATQTSETLLTLEDTGGSGAHSQITLKNTTGTVASILTTSDNLEFRVDDATVFANISGTEHMRIKSSGLVGIGTSAPELPLSVVGLDTQIHFSEAADGGGYLMSEADSQFRISGGAGFKVGGSGWVAKATEAAIIGHDSGGDIKFFSDTGLTAGNTFTPTERVRITSTGQVAIGHTTSGGSKLAVCDGANAQIQFFPEISTDTNLIQHYDPTASAYMASDNRASQYLFKIGTSEKMRITSAGRVGIGTSSPATTLHVNGNTKLETADNSNTLQLVSTDADANVGPVLDMFRDTSSPADNDNLGIINFRGKQSNGNEHTYASIGVIAADITAGTEDAEMVISLSSSGGNTEAIRILSNGNTGFGASPTAKLMAESDNTLITTFRLNDTSSGSTGRNIAVFQRRGTNVGFINVTDSATSFVTSSDYRLKENVNYDFDATSRLKQLKPARFNFIVNADTTVDGFIAHEVQSIVPEAITGTHNEVEVWQDGEELPDGVSVGDNKLDDNGNTIPKYQGIDQSKLVPLLVKTIQELEARITTLENA